MLHATTGVSKHFLFRPFPHTIYTVRPHSSPHICSKFPLINHLLSSVIDHPIILRPVCESAQIRFCESAQKSFSDFAESRFQTEFSRPPGGEYIRFHWKNVYIRYKAMILRPVCESAQNRFCEFAENQFSDQARRTCSPRPVRPDIIWWVSHEAKRFGLRIHIASSICSLLRNL